MFDHANCNHIQLDLFIQLDSFQTDRNIDGKVLHTDGNASKLHISKMLDAREHKELLQNKLTT